MGAILLGQFQLAELTSISLVLRGGGCVAAVLALYSARRSGSAEARALSVLYGVFFCIHAFFGLTEVLSRMNMLAVNDAFYMVQYENLLFLASLSMICTYLVVSGTMTRWNVGARVGLTAIAVIVGIGWVFLPFLSNPRYLYTLPDVTDFRIVDRARTQLVEEGIRDPSPFQVAERVTLPRWEGKRRLGNLPENIEESRVSELLAFTQGEDYVALLVRPQYERSALVSLTCVLLLILFFFLNYYHDPPSPTYFEKIHLTLLLFSIFEFIHSLALLSAQTFDGIRLLDRTGKLVTTIVMLLFAVFFAARLRFLNRAVAAFYEIKLAADPSSISRWRDGIDNAVMHMFFPKRNIGRRFLVHRPRSLDGWTSVVKGGKDNTNNE